MNNQDQTAEQLRLAHASARWHVILLIITSVMTLWFNAVLVRNLDSLSSGDALILWVSGALWYARSFTDSISGFSAARGRAKLHQDILNASGDRP